MRALTKNRPFLESRSNKRDIINDHADYASKVYAPVARQGRLPVKNQVVDYGIPLISNYQGLNALEASLPAESFVSKVQQPSRVVPKSAQGRKGQQIVADLAYVDKLLEEKKKEKKTVVIENVYKKFEPVVRAPTPSVAAPPNEDLYNAALLLQRLLRGRAVQNRMYEGKQNTLPLIRELRLAEENFPKAPKDPQRKLKRAIDAIQGEVLSHALDFMAKDIVRVSEEMKIMAMVKAANTTRRVREAEESGRRQAEDVLRKKREQQFAEMVPTHTYTLTLMPTLDLAPAPTHLPNYTPYADGSACEHGTAVLRRGVRAGGDHGGVRGSETGIGSEGPPPRPGS